MFSTASNSEFAGNDDVARDPDESALNDDGSASTQHDNELHPTSQTNTAEARPKPRPKRKRADGKDGGKVSEKQILDAILSSSESRKKAKCDDEFDTFGLSVAATIRRLTPRQQASGKVMTQQLLFTLEFGENDGTPISQLDMTTPVATSSAKTHELSPAQSTEPPAELSVTLPPEQPFQLLAKLTIRHSVVFVCISLRVSIHNGAIVLSFGMRGVIADIIINPRQIFCQSVQGFWSSNPRNFLLSPQDWLVDLTTV